MIINFGYFPYSFKGFSETPCLTLMRIEDISKVKKLTTVIVARKGGFPQYPNWGIRSEN